MDALDAQEAMKRASMARTKEEIREAWATRMAIPRDPNWSDGPLAKVPEGPPSKDKAQRVVDWALSLPDTKTAKDAARQINQSGYNKQMRAQDQDNINLDSKEYRSSGDYAAKAPDGRFVIAIPHPDDK